MLGYWGPETHSHLLMKHMYASFRFFWTALHAGILIFLSSLSFLQRRLNLGLNCVLIYIYFFYQSENFLYCHFHDYLALCKMSSTWKTLSNICVRIQNIYFWKVSFIKIYVQTKNNNQNIFKWINKNGLGTLVSAVETFSHLILVATLWGRCYNFTKKEALNHKVNK